MNLRESKYMPCNRDMFHFDFRARFESNDLMIRKSSTARETITQKYCKIVNYGKKEIET